MFIVTEYAALSKLENISIINFPKYPISLEVNKNIPEITNAKTNTGR